MTNQEAFDKVVRHLLTQNKGSRNTETCLYRGPDGLMCAVGCLIPDDQYTPALDGDGIGAEVSEIIDSVPALAGLDLDLLTDLQVVHDSSSVEDWRHELLKVANKHDLAMP